MNKIMPNRLDRGFFMYKEEFEKKAIDVLNSGWYVLGNEVKSFEHEFASYLGAKHCVGLASGLDALWIAFRLLGIGKGDEVIVSNDCVDTATATNIVAGDILEAKADQTQMTRVAAATGATAGSTAFKVEHKYIVPFPAARGTIGMTQQICWKIECVQE